MLKLKLISNCLVDKILTIKFNDKDNFEQQVEENTGGWVLLKTSKLQTLEIGYLDYNGFCRKINNVIQIYKDHELKGVTKNG
jgi:hypothetical protein